MTTASTATEATTRTLEAPGAVLTYDVRTNPQSTEPALFIIGSPTLPTGGCTNSTMTFSALTLRSADHVAQRLAAH